MSRFSFQTNDFEQSSFLSLSDSTKYTETSLSMCSQGSRPQGLTSGTFMMFIQGESKFTVRRRSQSDMQLSALKEWESLARLAGGYFTDVSINRCPRANVFNSFWESFWEILVTDYRYENSCPAFTLQKKVSPTCLYRFLLFYHSFVCTRVKEYPCASNEIYISSMHGRFTILFDKEIKISSDMKWCKRKTYGRKEILSYTPEENYLGVKVTQ